MCTVNCCFEERQKVISHMLTKKETAKVTVSVAELGLLVKLNHFLPTDWIFFFCFKGCTVSLFSLFHFRGILKLPLLSPGKNVPLNLERF